MSAEQLHPAHPPHHVHETAPLHDPVDSWHDHSRDQKPQHAHAEVGNAGAVMGVGLFLYFVVVGSCVLIDSFYRGFASHRLDQMEAASATGTSPSILNRKEKSDVLLHQRSSDPRWVVIPGSGEVPTRTFAQIPISLATDLVIKNYAPVINEPHSDAPAAKQLAPSNPTSAAVTDVPPKN